MNNVMNDVMTQRPQPGPATTYNFPRFERQKLASGVAETEVIVAPVHKLPIVTVLALFDAGASADPTGKEGIAQLTARALADGDLVLTDQLERIGTSVEAHAGWDSATVGMTVLSSKLPEAMKLMAEVITNPKFSEHEISRFKAERLAELMQIESEPRGLANEMFESFLYSSDARYSKPDGGTKESVAALTRDDVLEFYKSGYNLSNCKFIFVGDVTTDASAKLVEETIVASYVTRKSAESSASATSELRASPSSSPSPSPSQSQSQSPSNKLDTPTRNTRALQIVSRSDAPQSEIRVGHLGVPRNHPDHFALIILNSVLGGLFSSRINLNLREVHGYTYGATSSFDLRKGTGPFVISTAVQSEVTAAAVKEILLEIDRIRSTEISTDELSLATSYLSGVFPIKFETTSAIAAALAALIVYDLPSDWYDTYRSSISNVTLGDVLRAAGTYLNPSQLQIVVVGDPAIIKEPLEGLQFASVELK